MDSNGTKGKKLAALKKQQRADKKVQKALAQRICRLRQQANKMNMERWKSTEKKVTTLFKTLDAEKRWCPGDNIHNTKGFCPVTRLESSDMVHLLHCKWGVVIVKWDLDKGDWAPVHWTLKSEPKKLAINDGVWKLHCSYRKTTLFHRSLLEDGELTRVVDELVLNSRRKLDDEEKKAHALRDKVYQVSDVLSRPCTGMLDVDEDELTELLQQCQDEVTLEKEYEQLHLELALGSLPDVPSSSP